MGYFTLISLVSDPIRFMWVYLKSSWIASRILCACDCVWCKLRMSNARWRIQRNIASDAEVATNCNNSSGVSRSHFSSHYSPAVPLITPFLSVQFANPLKRVATEQERVWFMTWLVSNAFQPRIQQLPRECSNDDLLKNIWRRK